MPTYVTTITELDNARSGPQIIRVFSGEDARINAFRWANSRAMKLRPVGMGSPPSWVRVWKSWSDSDANTSEGSELTPVTDYEIQKAVRDEAEEE